MRFSKYECSNKLDLNEIMRCGKEHTVGAGAGKDGAEADTKPGA